MAYPMTLNAKHGSLFAVVLALALALAGGGCTTIKEKVGALTGTSTSLEGAQEVPPVSTRASGKSTIKIASDKTVSGTVSISDIQATAAHIHEGATGANGPVIVPLKKTSETSFTVPDNARLTDAQYQSFRAGKLYVNVHSAAHPGGEIRAQLKPD
jgi:CHRD domain